MSPESDIFRKKRVVFERLMPFGFQESQDGYGFCETILNGASEVCVHVAADGEASIYVIDTDLNGEYLTIHVT